MCEYVCVCSTTPRPATSTGSPFHGSGPSDPHPPTMLSTTFTSTTLGLEVPVLSSLPRRNNSPLGECGCKNTAWTFTATPQPRSQLTHDWMVGVLRPLFRHTVRTQHGVTASAGQRRCDVEIRHYLRDQAGSRSLVFDLPSRTIGLAQVATCSRTICYRIPRTSMRLCVLLRSAKLTAIGNNTLTIRTFLFSPPS